MTLDEILKEINKAEKIVILTHESPDGDAIGSSLATKLMLKTLGKSADVIIPEVPRMFDFLPSKNEIKEESDIKEYDLAISLDCADIKRLAKKEYFYNAKKTIVIDHHRSNTMYGDINFVNPVSPACCEILAGMSVYFSIPISKEIGTSIMTGIITDTGGFRHKGVTPETFEFTAELLRAGVNISEIYKKTLKTKSKASFELSKRVINRIELHENEKISYAFMNKDDEIQVGAKFGDHEGLVEIGLEVEGVEVSIFLRENDERTGYKISMRSTNEIDVSDICLTFGGGGHQKAAGAFISGNLNTVKEKILKETIKSMNKLKR